MPRSTPLEPAVNDDNRRTSPEAATSPAEAILAAWMGRISRGEFQQLIQQRGALQGIEIGSGLITIIGAPPGAGKTALVMQCMFDAIELDTELRAVVANAETTFDGLLQREIIRRTWLPQLGCVDSKKIRFGPLTVNELERVARAASELAPKLERVAVLNEPCNVIQLAELRDEAPGLLIVDYIQKFAPGDKDARAGVNEVMALLRMLAKSGWAVVGLSATKRDPNGRHSSKELSLSSFRESGEIEYNADSAYVLQDNGQLENPYIRHVTLGHVKNRHGAMVSKELRFDMPRMQFTARVQPEPLSYEEFGGMVDVDDPFYSGTS